MELFKSLHRLKSQVLGYESGKLQFLCGCMKKRSNLV